MVQLRKMNIAVITRCEISLCITRSEVVLGSHKLLVCPRNLKNLMFYLGFVGFH